MANILNAHLVIVEGRVPVVRIGSNFRRDPLGPYITTDEPDEGYPGGPMVLRARIVLPDSATDHVNAVALQFDRADAVDTLIALLQDVRRELSSTFPTEDEMEAPY